MEETNIDNPVTYVNGFCFNESGSRLLLLEKERPEWQKGLLNGIGGEMEKGGQTASEAMVRKFKEEAGVETKSEEWELFCKVLFGDEDSPSCIFFFRLFSDSAHAIAETQTDEEIQDLSFQSVTQNDYIVDSLVPDLRWIIPLAEDPDGTLVVGRKNADTSFLFDNPSYSNDKAVA